jgi:putative nucleotidyltransferase with HDIG domain
MANCVPREPPVVTHPGYSGMLTVRSQVIPYLDDGMSEMTTRILFVDDEPLILRLIADLLEAMAPELEPTLATSGSEALALMAEQKFEVVVSDMRMPKMSGAELFREVQRLHPETLRIILSGYADHAQVMQAVAVAHQFMMKPLEVKSLFDTLERLQELRQWLMNESLRGLVGQMTCLPSMPTIYFRILDALRSMESSIDEIADMISADPALTAKLLQVVNSAFFGFSRQVQSVGEAVQLLGVSRIRSLALSAHVFAAFDKTQHSGMPMEAIRQHCFHTACLAQKVAQSVTSDPTLLEQCFTAGALHDIGKLILGANAPAEYRRALAQARSRSLPLVEVEREVFGASHADVGAYLLGLWGLPVPLVEGIALHHEPGRARQDGFSPATAVHVANSLARWNQRQGDQSSPLDQAYLARLGLPVSLDAWADQLDLPQEHREDHSPGDALCEVAVSETAESTPPPHYSKADSEARPAASACLAL